MAKVTGPHGIDFLIDKKDLKKLKGYRINDQFYIRLDRRENGKLVRRPLHHVIMDWQSKKGWVIDHINGNTLDCRRRNLRVCRNSENRMNQAAQVGRKYKGIYFYRGRSGRAYFRVQVMAHGKSWSKNFFDEHEAVIAYNRMARKMQGKFARLNVWTGPSVKLRAADLAPRRRGVHAHRQDCSCRACQGKGRRGEQGAKKQRIASRSR